MNDYISREYLLAEYDRQHQGPPGGTGAIKVSNKVLKNGALVLTQGWVGCPKCGIYKQWTNSPDGAVKVWNRRVSDG